MNTPTPETDVVRHCDYPTIIETCRKLERERDEYKKLLSETLKSDMPVVERLLLERDQLRKVCDDFANRIRNVRPIVREDGSREDWIDCQIDEMLRDYNSLPHVIAAKKGNEV